MSSAAPGKDDGHKIQPTSALVPQTTELIKQVLWSVNTVRYIQYNERLEGV